MGGTLPLSTNQSASTAHYELEGVASAVEMLE